MEAETPTHIHGGKNKLKTSLFKNKWCWIGTLLLILFIGGAIFLTIKLVPNYKKHSDHFNSNKNANFQLDSLSLSQFQPSPSTSLLTATWDVQFSIKNPTSSTPVYYQTVAVAVVYGHELLSTASVPPFHLRGSEWTPQKVMVMAQEVKMKNGSTIAVMEAERGQGTVGFDVGVYAGYWIGDSEVSGKYWAVEVFCYDVKVVFESKDFGKSTAGPVPCKIVRTW